MNVDSEHLCALATEAGELLKSQGMQLVTAESCTGGWLSKVITDIPGSSHWFDRGFITYTNMAKREMLGVSPETLVRYGAVSEEAVREMVSGALKRSHAQVSVAVSGIAGPGGATIYKPVGMVCLAWNVNGTIKSITQQFEGNREQIRAQAVRDALQGILKVCERH
ncbi:MAG: CinA family protein [Nitrospira sp.]|nr:CinA family protein [Nitrospira sp.]